MNFKYSLCFIFLIIHSQLNAQEPEYYENQTNAQIYQGGRNGFFYLGLTLFPDSTYDFRAFGHIKQRDRGFYHLTDTSITLVSEGYVPHKNKLNKKNKILFPNLSSKKTSQQIYLFTDKQLKKDRYNYYQKYYTLSLKEISIK